MNRAIKQTNIVSSDISRQEAPAGQCLQNLEKAGFSMSSNGISDYNARGSSHKMLNEILGEKLLASVVSDAFIVIIQIVI
ncbi:hypothetical protein TNCV_1684051 [Trichonephila clavipes]|nr:hypothetical protein TNCV_1684051 [Trichonephila clavipes]